MPEATEKLIDVFDTNDDSEALVVRGLLESEGLAVLMSTPEAPANVLPFNALPLGHIRIQVLEPDAETAFRLIAEYRRGGAEAAEEAELASEGEPTPPAA
jgi:hypothetical protein